MALSIQVHHVRAAHRDAALLEDVQLHRDVGQVLLFL